MRDQTLDKALLRDVADLIERAGIHRHAWPEVRDLAVGMARIAGVAVARSRIRYAGEKTAGASRDTRGGRAIAMLRSMVLRLEEKGAPRTHSLAR